MELQVCISLMDLCESATKIRPRLLLVFSKLEIVLTDVEGLVLL